MSDFDKEALEETERRRREWEEGPLKQQLKRFGISESPNKFYTPVDIKEHDFVEEVGFPGEYPFTAGKYASQAPEAAPRRGGGHISGGKGLVRTGRYSGYGTAEDTRDYYKMMISWGQTAGPNLAFDLPTQCGYDSDAPEARGEVGKTGVAIDTLMDFKTIYEPYVGDLDLDKIATAWTINPMANIILAMYIALAEERGIPKDKLRCTPQNDILKEAVARGTTIFPLKPSMRMVRDTIIYSVTDMPALHPVSIPGHHHREAGASRPQVLAFCLADGIAYIQLGIDAGLDVDTFAPRLTFLDWSGSQEIFKEVALRRAARRMWAKIMRERFKAKNPRSWLLRDTGGAMAGFDNFIRQRPLNNLIRSVLGGVAEALSGDIPTCYPPYDEALGTGHSLEGLQLIEDAARIITYEARLCEVLDPLAGSYYVEYLTDEIENGAWEIINEIDKMGGMVAAVESGWVDREIAKSALTRQRAIETGEQVVVGLNRFISEEEIEVNINRQVPHPYDPEKRAKAEEQQVAKLQEVRKKRDNQAVQRALKQVKEAAQDESVNIIPPLVDAVKVYATVGEITNTLKEVFGVWQDTEI